MNPNQIEKEVKEIELKLKPFYYRFEIANNSKQQLLAINALRKVFGAKPFINLRGYDITLCFSDIYYASLRIKKYISRFFETDDFNRKLYFYRRITFLLSKIIGE
jgi:hypothetical protein